MTEKFTLRRRLALAFAIVGAVVVVIAALATGALVRTDQQTDRLVNDINPARVQSAELESAYLNQETGLRGFVNARQADFLQPYRDGGADEELAAEALRNYLPDDDEVIADLDRVLALGRQWRAEYAEPTIAAVRAGRTPVATDLGKRLFDQVRNQLTTLQAHIADLRATSIARLHSANRLLYLTVSVAVAGVVLAAVLLWVAQRRWIIQPLAQLADNTRQVSSGDIAHQVPATGPAEIADVATDVETMRRSLVAALTTTLAAQEQLKTAADKLVEQADDLRRSNAELEQFAYVASHDLQEPLRKVASFCQMLERRYKGQLDERGEQYIAFAVDGAKRMQRLINDLLGFSRVGRTAGDFVEMDLDDALERAMISLTTSREESGAEITADPLPRVAGTLGLLTQVFQNLIGNAIKFRGDEPPRIRLTVTRAGTDWQFCCADNGIGVEDQYADRVFVLFQRLHSKEEYDGTGIGLAMCRKIIEHHGGRIWLNTDEDAAGTRICWTLPMLPADAEVPADTAPAPDGGGTVTAAAAAAAGTTTEGTP